VFDLDGTLVDSRANIVRAVEEVSRILGLPCPHIDVIPRVIGLSLDEALARLFPEVDGATHKTLEAEYRTAFVRLRASPGYDEPLFAGTQELLAELSAAGFLLGVATGKAPRGVRHLFDRHKLHDHFVTIQTPENARGKPHPQMVLQAMSDVGARPENTVMIGDTTFDIEMGRAAGARAIGVAWGNHPAAELAAAGAHRLVERMADLAQAVHDLTSPLPTA
jgi:phosphoglycolate phosphatase